MRNVVYVLFVFDVGFKDQDIHCRFGLKGLSLAKGTTLVIVL